MLKAIFAASMLLMGFAGLYGVRVPGAPPSGLAGVAQESWQKEFDDICSKTQDAMTLTPEELTELIKRSDVLQPQLEKLDESRKKVYTERLRKCRGLYAYVLDSKRNEKK